MKLCFLIPVYNHKDVLGWILDELEQYGLPCILIDDGSELACQQEMERQAASREWVILERLPSNGGKGAAVKKGLQVADARGFSHAFQLDADGQHNLADISKFIKIATANERLLVLGQSKYDESVPKSRLYGRYITHFWVWLETLSFAIKDTMCGFRIYPVKPALVASSGRHIGLRMSYDIEVVVRMFWLGVPVLSVPTLVRYPLDGISHFDVLRDNVQISWTHTKLVAEMLIRLPVLLLRKLLPSTLFNYRDGP